MAQAEYTTAVLADSPVAFWKLDEASGLPQDSSGNGLHITTTSGAPTYQTTGPFSGSFGIAYTGTQNHSRGCVSTATAAVTIEAWLDYSASSTTVREIYYNGTGANGYGIQTNEPFVRLVISGVASTSSNVAKGTGWVHVAYTYNGTSWSQYWNGDLYLASVSTQAITTPTGTTRFGSPVSSVTVSVSNAAIYETALSAARIRAHYEAAIGWTSKPLNTVFTSPQSLA